MDRTATIVIASWRPLTITFRYALLYQAQWVFWIPVQLLNFRYVPVRHQLNVVLGTSIVWTALLSMWYPPMKNEDDKNEPSVDEFPVM